MVQGNIMQLLGKCVAVRLSGPAAAQQSYCGFAASSEMFLQL